MKIIIIALLGLSNPAFAEDWNLYDGDTALSPAEISSEIIGNTLVFYDGGKSRFSAEGGYTYSYESGASSFGQYVVEAEGAVCVNFDNGWGRCDKYIFNAGRLILLTEKGERFPIKTVTQGTGQ